MGRSQAPATAVEQRAGADQRAPTHQVEVTVTEVTAQDYLAHRRALPHLLELAPHLQPAAFHVDADKSTVAEACDAARSSGGPQPDVRLLVDDGERHLALADALASTLRCDVYLTPEGSRVRFIRESSGVTGDLWDAISTDRETGEPAQWLVVRPADLPGHVPTWFTTVRGRLRKSNGLVTVALPDGMAFATKNTFRDAVYLATHIRKSSSRVTTVAVNADLGRFEISRFANSGSLLGGVEFATLVAASLDLIHPDVQLAVTWPTDVTACAALDAEIVHFADALNRTVWVPRPNGATFVLAGCGEFTAVDEVGGPSSWRAYPGRLTSESSATQYRTDLDGRLVPVSEPVVTVFRAVPFVSIPKRQLDSQRAWYESMTRADGLFALDVGVLSDGRLGVVLGDGGPAAIGPRALRALLREAGWSNEDLVLLAQVPKRYWDETIQHLRSLTESLTVNIWLPATEAEVWAAADGGFAADPQAAEGDVWRVVAYGRSADLDSAVPDGVARPAALTVGPRPADRPRRQALRPVGAVAAEAAGEDVEPPSAVPVSAVDVPGVPSDPLAVEGESPAALPAVAEPTVVLPTVTASAIAEPTVVLPTVAVPTVSPAVVEAAGGVPGEAVPSELVSGEPATDVAVTAAMGATGATPDTDTSDTDTSDPAMSDPAAPGPARLDDAVRVEAKRFEATPYDAARYEAARYDAAAQYEATPYAGARYEATRSDESRYGTTRSEATQRDAAPYDMVRHEALQDWSVPREDAATVSAADSWADGSGLAQRDPIEAVAVTLARVQGASGPHAVPWLPPTPVVNRRATDLYLWTPLATDQIEAWGLPSADLFLLAGQDPLRLADRHRDGYLLRLMAPEESAVDLSEHAGHAPPAIRQRLLDTGCTHLLPLAWLSDLRVTARYDLDGRGGVSARDDIAVGELAIRFEGAEHGVPGLPNEVVHWPDKAQRANLPSYLMLPDEPVVDRDVVHRGYVPLWRRKPALVDGQRLLEVKVPKRRAIDVPATLDSLGGLPIVGRMHDFVGLDLLLSADDLPTALVSRVWRHGPTGKPVVERLNGENLSAALATPMLTPVS